MVSANLERLIKQAEQLTPDEQAQLVAHLTKAEPQGDVPRRKWRDVLGTLTYPAAGEDAQEWVSRTRREADDVREARQSNTAGAP